MADAVLIISKFDVAIYDLSSRSSSITTDKNENFECFSSKTHEGVLHTKYTTDT